MRPAGRKKGESVRIRVSRGLQEDGIAVGNTYDKYGTRNPIARRLTRNFGDNLNDLVRRAGPSTIHEIGCGEGYWSLTWARQGYDVRGSDFSHQVIALAKDNAAANGVDPHRFHTRSVYDVQPERDTADLVVCCEVLEHLEDPRAGLTALQKLDAKHVIMSVPREPLWRGMNMARGKYLTAFGNTPGHLNHWSTKAFVGEVARHFEIIELRRPLPWTMVLCRPPASR